MLNLIATFDRAGQNTGNVSGLNVGNKSKQELRSRVIAVGKSLWKCRANLNCLQALKVNKKKGVSFQKRKFDIKLLEMNLISQLRVEFDRKNYVVSLFCSEYKL